MEQRGLPLLVKRSVDVTAAAVGLLVASPLLVGVGVAVRWKLGSPVLFRQVRPGREERLFTLYKFRTMTDARDAEGRLLPDAERQTRLGRFLRSTSLDELPQLWNVLVGELSLVGPRPLLVEYLPRYGERQRLRFRVLPGITGLAAVEGRNALDWPTRLELDARYVERWTPWLDWWILARTVLVVLRRQGVSHPGHVTMPEFTGERS